MDSQTEVEREALRREAEDPVANESVQSVEQEHRLWTMLDRKSVV